MKYFVVSNGATVVEKHAYAGDDAKANALIAQFLVAHPTYTVQEVDKIAFDAAVCVPDPVPLRNSALDKLLTGTAPDDKLMRAILLVILDELNALRQRDRDRSVDVAAATTLADLKTRWAAESTLADRTPAQAKTAIQSKINAGVAD